MIGCVEETKVYSMKVYMIDHESLQESLHESLHSLTSDRQNLFNVTATPSSKAQAMTTTPQKSIVCETNFHVWST